MANRPKAPTSVTPNIEAAVPSGNSKQDIRSMEAARKSNGDAREPAVDDEIQLHLGQKLKDTYADLIKQPVPDKFRQLLEDLEREEKKR